MGVVVGVLKETAANETRVALIPEVATKLKGLGATVRIERGAGTAAHFADQAYGDAELGDAAAILASADVLLCVQPPAIEVVNRLKEGALVVGFMQAYARPDLVRALQSRRIASLAMESVPRISRAQSMDALSSQASVAGYKAALIAANTLEKFLPMLTTAAGTIRPAAVLVIGAGVAGLQAIATAKRLGAVVEAYDVRSATKDQVKSLGAKFIETGVSAEGTGGYARELTPEERQKQQEVLDARIAASDAVISTASVPGRAAPRIISRAAVERMRPGSVIVDLAAEQGGNCELTRAGETVLHNGVKVVGPVNLPATLPYHASEMYARNLFNLLKPAIVKGELAVDWQDEVFAGAVLTRDGTILNEAARKSVEGQTPGGVGT
jgi:H+-translocating NAD(P) transhydrogenase subunit alpha